MKKIILFVLFVLLFTLAGCSKNQTNTVSMASQTLNLSSIENARELGGYVTQDGKTVKHGVLIRTAALTNISDEEKNILVNDFNLSAIVDFRASYETLEEPEPIIHEVSQYNFKIMDEKMMAERAANISEALKDPNVNAIERMYLVLENGIISDQMYVEFLTTEVGKIGYRDFFQVLLNTPEGSSVLWHCTNGKDRTGVAAMLLLGVLNVDENTIMEDFMLTNEFFAEEINVLRESLEPYIQDKDLLDELMVAGRGVYAPYMQNAIDYINENYGSITEYVKVELGLSDADIIKLQQMYTE